MLGLVKYVSYKRGLMKHWSHKVGSFFDGNKRAGKYKIYLEIDHVKARKCFIVVTRTSIVFVIFFLSSLIR
jgi:hypothetical protein